MDRMHMYQESGCPPVDCTSARWPDEEIDNLLEFVLNHQDDYCSERKPALLNSCEKQWAEAHKMPERLNSSVLSKISSLIYTVHLIDYFNSVYGGGADPSIITVGQADLQAVASCIAQCQQEGMKFVASVLRNFVNKPFPHYEKVKRIMQFSEKAVSTSSSGLVVDRPHFPDQPAQPPTFSTSSIAAWVDQLTLATPPTPFSTPSICPPSVSPPLSISSRGSSAATQQLKRPSASRLQPGPPSFPSTGGLQPAHPSFPSQEPSAGGHQPALPSFPSTSGEPGPDPSFPSTSGLQPVHSSFPSHEPSTSALQPGPITYHPQMPWAGNLQTNSPDVPSASNFIQSQSPTPSYASGSQTESDTQSLTADIRFLREMQLSRQEQPFPIAEPYVGNETKIMSAFVNVAGSLNNLSSTLQQAASDSPEMINHRLARTLAEEPIDVHLQAKLYLYFSAKPAEAAPLPDMPQELRRAIFDIVLASKITGGENVG